MAAMGSAVDAKARSMGRDSLCPFAAIFAMNASNV
jgi:hypothetical protein